MLYMIDRRLVIIAALYLSIHSVFVDVMHSANHRSRSECILVVFFIIEQWFVFLLSLVPSTHLHHAEAHFTLLISAHPAISPHSLPSFVVIFSLVMLAVVNCNLPVSDLNGSHAQFI